MLGAAFKLTAQTEVNLQTSTVFYFPAGSWCDIFSPETECMNLDEGSFPELSTMPHEVYVHLYEGHIVPMQDATTLGVMNTADLMGHPVDFHILGNPDNSFKLDWYAQGTYINDDGLVFDHTGTYNHYELAAYPEPDGSGSITVIVSIIASATAATDDTIPDCTDVNTNDILGDLYFYNSVFLSIDGVASYDTTVNYAGDSVDPTVYNDSARYDDATQRVVFENPQTEQICLPNVTKIVLTPVTA